MSEPIEPVVKTEEQWKAQLTPEQYRVLREKGTELPGTGEYLHTKTTGVYRCAACGAVLFSSETKFDSHCGWPSFYDKIKDGNIIEKPDYSLPGRPRTEILCAHCGGHLGHVFPDGPQPTGDRYCVNSVSLTFEPAGDADTDASKEENK